MGVSLGFFSRKVFPLTISCVVRLVFATSAMNPDTNRTYHEIVIGGLGFKGKDALFEQWNDTFSVYLSEEVGPAFGVTFKLVYLDFTTTYKAVERREVDMVYTNPSVYACLEREHRASPVASLRNRRKVGDEFYELDHFYGTIFVKHNSPITKIEEIANKTVEAVSLIGLGACQLQWDELTNRGIHFLSAPRQVRFSSSQKKIVKDVIAGDVDIGMVRTDLAEAMVSDGEIEPGSVRVLENLQGHPNDPTFPFPYSTRLAAPEWSLAALPWTDWRISYEVSQALMAITPDHQAAVSGKYATWVPPLSYFGMHQMQTNLNWIDSNNKCIRAGDICETVVCPKGQLKKSCEQILRGCEEIGEPCPEGYTCLCNPCHPLPDKTCGGRENFVFREQDAQCVCRSGFEQLPGTDECVEIADSESTSVRIVLAVVLVVAALVFLVASWVYHLQGHKQDDSWKISLDELKFPETCVVLGRGTYGQVLLADFRSTPVAVKRVLPKTNARVDAISSYDGPLQIAASVAMAAGASDVHLEEEEHLQRGRSGSGGSAGVAIPGTPSHVLRIDLRTKSVDGKAAAVARYRDIAGEDGGDAMGRNLTSPEDLGRESTYGRESTVWRESAFGRESRMSWGGDGLEDRGSLSIKQAWSGTGQARASQMQLQVRFQENDSRSSMLGFSRKQLLPNKSRLGSKFSSKVAGAPAGRMTGSATTIAPFQLKVLTKEFLQEMQVYR
mmetsp:Transcript_40289/g.75468  ORF Transcript_40289/g.75468 Transcript_40289/m.75468 type:complete len:726 (-) Transcript_40289:840-3017(-)